MEAKVWFGGLCGLLGLASKKSCGVLLVPGFAGDKDESHNLFKDAASYLQSKGFSTLRYDPTGLGESVGDFSKTSLDTLVVDYEKAADYLRSQRNVDALAVVGFSLGASIAIMADDKRVISYSFWAPALDLRKDMHKKYVENGEYEKARNGVSEKNGKTVGVEMYDSFATSIARRFRSIRVPVHIIHGHNDERIPWESSKRLYTKFKKSTLHLVTGVGHSFRKGDDLSMRKEVYKLTAEFFEKNYREFLEKKISDHRQK